MWSVTLQGLDESFVKYRENFLREKLNVQQLTNGELSYDDYIAIGVDENDVVKFIEAFPPVDDDEYWEGLEYFLIITCKVFGTTWFPLRSSRSRKLLYWESIKTDSTQGISTPF